MIQRWIGVDYGTARIGIALGTNDPAIASPLRVVAGTGSVAADAMRLVELVAAEEAVGLVIGLPLNMNGTHGPQAALVHKLVEAIRRLATIPIELWDERLSTHHADELLASAGRPAGKNARGRDAMAAKVILQSFLDARYGTEGRGAAPPQA